MNIFETMDQAIFHFINTSLTNSVFDIFFPSITDLHKTDMFKIFFIPLFIVTMVWVRRRSGLILTVMFALSMGLADKFGNILKHFWERNRPFMAGIDAIQRSPAGGFSFPSNHSVTMFCMAFFLSRFFPQYRVLFFTIASLVAFSRIYNGVHFPADVFAGALIGSTFGYFGSKATVKFLEKMKYQKKEKQNG